MLTPTDVPTRTGLAPAAFGLSLALALALTALLAALSARLRGGAALAFVPMGDPVRTAVVAFNLFFALPYLAAFALARLVRRGADGHLLAGLHAALAFAAMGAWFVVALLRLAS